MMSRVTRPRTVSLISLSTAIVAAVAWLLSLPLAADDAVSFKDDVWPILEEKCVSCHGPGDAFNNLRLDSAEDILKGGKNGKALEPGNPDESPMFVRVTLPPDDLDIMPAEGDPLTEEEVEVLRSWIASGADFGGWENADS